LLRHGLVALQVVLIAASLYFAHRIVSRLVRSDPVPEASIPPVEAPPARDRSWSNYQVIATRNLFHSRSLAAVPAEATPTEDEIEESALPVKLLGTAAVDPEGLSIAAVLDQSANLNLRVRKGDLLAGAEVVSIERRRLVVRNRGKLEAIMLDEEAPAGEKPPPPRSARPRPPRAASPASGRPANSGLAGRVQQLTQQAEGAAKPAPALEPPPATLNTTPTGSILTQARMLPSYDEGGALRGLQLSGIKRGSVLESAGFQEGDVVKSVNGTAITSPAQGLRVLRELNTGQAVAVEVDRSGENLTLDYSPGAR
jgi:type II secretion system protein C